MSLSIADLRAQRSKDLGSITESLNKKTEWAKDDEGFWKLDPDKVGNASATIRFLPKHQDDELPYVQIRSHGFKGSAGKWLIDNCPTTIDKPCPVCEANTLLYATKTEADKKTAGERKKRVNYITNILVISDTKHPENEGKVFRFKFGAKIFAKIVDKIQPTFEDETPVNVFDLWEGANFKLRMSKVEGYPNYDKSVFSEPSTIADTDKEILEIVNQQVSLSVLIAPEKFKSYDALQKRLMLANGETVPETNNAKAEDLAAQLRETVKPKIESERVKESPVVASSTAPDEDEDIESYFNNLTK